MTETFDQWLTHATENLAQAKRLAAEGSYSDACFHARQALFKGLKANAAQRHWEDEGTESVRDLVQLHEEHGFNLACTKDDLDFLSSLCGVRPLPEDAALDMVTPEPQQASRAIDLAEAVLLQVGITLERRI